MRQFIVDLKANRKKYALNTYHNLSNVLTNEMSVWNEPSLLPDLDSMSLGYLYSLKVNLRGIIVHSQSIFLLIMVSVLM